MQVICCKSSTFIRITQIKILLFNKKSLIFGLSTPFTGLQTGIADTYIAARIPKQKEITFFILIVF